MSSLTFHYCKQLCTKAISSGTSRVSATLSHPRSRPLQLSAADRISVPPVGGGEDKKDFDEDRDTLLGDFSKYNISSDTVNRLKRAGVNHLFEVQYKTYNEVRDGIDCFVQARTGTGKTLGFALPIIEAVQSVGPQKTTIFPRPPQVVTIAPTRELAMQIAKEFEKFAAPKTKVSCFYGGVPIDRQIRDLYQGVDILVGTPGRIKDHLLRGKLNLSTVKHVILDEADRMLDMGFQRDIEDIFSYAYTESNKPQTLLFSATLPNWVRDITRKYTSDNMQRFDLITTAVKSAILVDHVSVQCTAYQHADVVDHFVRKHCGRDGKALVFTATKRAAERLARQLPNADYITGDKSQNAREYTLAGFKRGRFNVLVATDVAARGLDIPKIDLVVQTEPPKDVDSYIHRAGRTGRAGTNGLSVVLFDRNQLKDMGLVEKHAGIRFATVEGDEKLDLLLPTHGDIKGFESSRGSSSNVGGNRRRTQSFSGFDRRPSRDFGGDRRPSRDFGGSNRRSSFGGFDRRTSSEDIDSEDSGELGQYARSRYDNQRPSQDFDRRSSRDFGGSRTHSRDFGGSQTRSRDFGGFQRKYEDSDRKPSQDFRGFDSQDSNEKVGHNSRFSRRPTRSFRGDFGGVQNNKPLSDMFGRQRPSKDGGGSDSSDF